MNIVQVQSTKHACTYIHRSRDGSAPTPPPTHTRPRLLFGTEDHSHPDSKRLLKPSLSLSLSSDRRFERPLSKGMQVGEKN